MKSNIRQTTRLKEKVTIAYGMVLCLVTLTDLKTCRAGLSVSAELFVKLIVITVGFFCVHDVDVSERVLNIWTLIVKLCKLPSSSVVFCCVAGFAHPFSVSPSLFVLSCPFE